MYKLNAQCITCDLNIFSKIQAMKKRMAGRSNDFNFELRSILEAYIFLTLLVLKRLKIRTNTRKYYGFFTVFHNFSKSKRQFSFLISKLRFVSNFHINVCNIFSRRTSTLHHKVFFSEIDG